MTKRRGRPRTKEKDLCERILELNRSAEEFSIRSGFVIRRDGREIRREVK